MERIKEIGRWIVGVGFVMAIGGGILKVSGWHLGEVNGSILLLALTSTFFMCCLSSEIPENLRRYLAWVSAFCWVGLVHQTNAHGTWQAVAYMLAIVGPFVLALAADLTYAAVQDEETLRADLH